MPSKTGKLWDGKRHFVLTDTDAAGQPGAASGLFTVTDLADGAVTNQKFLDSMQAPNEGHFPNNTIDQALGTINDAPVSMLGELRDAFSNAWPAHSRHASGSNGDGTASFTLDTASTVTVAPGLTGTGTAAQPASNVTTVVAAGGTVELAHAYSGTISFAGPTGTLIIDHASSFSGTITGQLAIGDVIDLADIAAGANVTIAYSGNNSPGTLTVSDGTHTANIALDGIYSLANFTASSDGHGGTFVIDPPVTQTAYSLRQIDGGPNYFAQFSNSLPTDPSFFAVGAWLEGVQTQQDINLDKAAGLDMYVGITANSNFSLIQNNGMYVIAQQDELKTNPTVLSNSSTTGWLLYDEIDLSLGPAGHLNAKQHHRLAAERRTLYLQQLQQGRRMVGDDRTGCAIRQRRRRGVGGHLLVYRSSLCTGWDRRRSLLEQRQSTFSITNQARGKLRLHHRPLARTGRDRRRHSPYLGLCGVGLAGRDGSGWRPPNPAGTK